VQPIVVVTDEPEKYPHGTAWAPGVTIRHRDELDKVQRELREVPGVSALIYDQTCASEKRRRRKRNEYPDPAKRAVINEMVCEGCGDCSVKSNCLSVEPLETEYGRKRVINQSSCNKDYSCLKGFCPSFVTVEGGRLKKGKSSSGGKSAEDFPVLPEPTPAPLTSAYGILVTGIGGTGVITIGQIVGMAAHLEGKGVSVLDMSGLAQKYGAVMSHVQIAARPEDIHATRLDTGGAHLVLGCDLVVTASAESIGKMAPSRTRAVVNATVTPTAEFVKNPNWQLPGSDLQRDIADTTQSAEFVAATELASALMGDAIATNMFMLGYAHQKGWVPLSGESLERAIELNAVAVDFNKKSFLWGRRAAADLEKVKRIASPAEVISIDQHFSRNLDELVERRTKFLTEYQNAAYAERYKRLVERVKRVEQDKTASTKLAEAVARAYHRLLAYKDEYEVARLHANGNFEKKIEGMFEGDYKVAFYLAPPLFAKSDPITGEPRKMRFGPWILPVFKVLKSMKFLRGSALDPFGYTEERRMERELIGEFEQSIERLLSGLTSQNHALAVQIASIPDEMRGFGYIKKRNVDIARTKRDELLARFEAPAQRAAA
jgi:indolepyruvate ferredoxin oxidoreductase